jgi:DNA-binding NarL/FixJ family response regulator
MKSILSNNQLEVARLIALDMSNQQIALRVGVKDKTIRNDVSVIIKILNVRSRVGIALWYYKHKMIINK